MSLMLSYIVLSCFPLDVLDEIWDRTESAPEIFPTYSSISAAIFCILKCFGLAHVHVINEFGLMILVF